MNLEVDNLSVINEIPIYIQGGYIGKLVTGGAVDFAIKDIDINLDIAKKNNTEEQITYTFKLSNINELDDWLNAGGRDFLAKCVRKFKLHMSYSMALRGFFFQLVRLFEKYVLDLHKMANVDIDKLLQEYDQFNHANSLDSSSIILYKFGKDENLNKYLENKAPYLAEYIKDNDRWSYLGWCPLVPDVRFKHLLDFPLEEVCRVLGHTIDFSSLSLDICGIKKIESPSCPPVTSSQAISATVEEKALQLRKKIESIKPELEAWEDYYSKCAAQVIEQVNIFKKYFVDFQDYPQSP